MVGFIDYINIDNRPDDFSSMTIGLSNGANTPHEDLCNQLLEVNPLFRLGTQKNDVEVIKNHPFFFGIDWDALEHKEITPPFIPDLAHDHDTSYFDRKLTTLSFDEGVCDTIVID